MACPRWSHPAVDFGLSSLNSHNILLDQTATSLRASSTGTIWCFNSQVRGEMVACEGPSAQLQEDKKQPSRSGRCFSLAIPEPTATQIASGSTVLGEEQPPGCCR
jgi:hypothetical protein